MNETRVKAFESATKGRTFCKTNVIEDLQNEIDYLVKRHQFDLGNGYAQLQGADAARKFAYGELKFVQCVLSQILDGFIEPRFSKSNLRWAVNKLPERGSYPEIGLSACNDGWQQRRDEMLDHLEPKG